MPVPPRRSVVRLPRSEAREDPRATFLTLRTVTVISDTDGVAGGTAVHRGRALVRRRRAEPDDPLLPVRRRAAPAGAVRTGCALRRRARPPAPSGRGAPGPWPQPPRGASPPPCGLRGRTPA